MEDMKIKKLENPQRLEELSPKETLIKAGFAKGMTLCDIGAGTGIFTFPAAQISGEAVHALEVSDSMINLLHERVEAANLENIQVHKVSDRTFPLKTASCDMVLLVTVLHEIDDKSSMLREIKRVLKPKGKLIIIEFHKGITPMGPPADYRLDQEDVVKICLSEGLDLVEGYSMGDNLYLLKLQS